MVKMVKMVIVSLVLLALLFLQRRNITLLYRHVVRWRIRAKERELAATRLRLQEAYLSCASNLNASAHEARKAMIAEALRLGSESGENFKSSR